MHVTLIFKGFRRILDPYHTSAHTLLLPHPRTLTHCDTSVHNLWTSPIPEWLKVVPNVGFPTSILAHSPHYHAALRLNTFSCLCRWNFQNCTSCFYQLTGSKNGIDFANWLLSQRKWSVGTRSELGSPKFCLVRIWSLFGVVLKATFVKSIFFFFWSEIDTVTAFVCFRAVSNFDCLRNKIPFRDRNP